MYRIWINTDADKTTCHLKGLETMSNSSDLKLSVYRFVSNIAFFHFNLKSVKCSLELTMTANMIHV